MTAETSETNTKVARVIRKYDLDGMGANLETAWTGKSGERTSLRNLADEFNEAVLEAVLRKANVSSVSVSVSSTYDALQSESGSSKTRARRHLEREEINVDELTGDFVTHQAIHTYLTEEREANFPEPSDDMAERKVETIEKLEGRVSAVAETAISSLANADELDDDGYDVLVDVRAICPHCGADLPVGELIRQDGCGCGAKFEAADE